MGVVLPLWSGWKLRHPLAHALAGRLAFLPVVTQLLATAFIYGRRSVSLEKLNLWAERLPLPGEVSMMSRHEAFGRMLSQAIYIIKMLEEKNLSIVQDELGYALQRKGGSAVERWRKGHLPPSTGDVEMLARILIRRSQGHLSRQWLETFLHYAGHPDPGKVVEEIFVASLLPMLNNTGSIKSSPNLPPPLTT